MNTYDEVQRAVSFLRWHAGDADALAPSLYKGRTGKGAVTEGVKTPAQPVGSGAGSG